MPLGKHMRYQKEKNMKKVKRILATVLATALLLSAAACASTTTATTAAATTAATTAAGETTAAAVETTAAGATFKVGVAMPTQSSERWIADGANIKGQLEALGYVVDLQYAEDDVQAQVNQIENMITNGANCLVIAAIDSSALVNILAKAKESEIPVIAYDRLLMNTDAVSYYATFDNYQVGVLQASYLVDALGLKDGKGPFNVELFAGSPDDNNATLFWNGAMDTLQQYIDSKQIVVLSGQVEFEKCAILRWSQEGAQARMENILSGTYSGGAKVDGVLSPYDGLSYGIAAALEGAGYTVGEGWPLITGQDAELMGVKNLISGKQAMTVFKDTRVLASKCVKMVEAVLKGTEPEINDTKTYDNGVLVVPSFLCTPVAVTKDNYVKEVIDAGYYTAEQVAG